MIPWRRSLITLAQSLLWPIIYGIAARFGPWLFPVLSFILTGSHHHLRGPGWTTSSASVASRWPISGPGSSSRSGSPPVNTLLAALFAIDDEQAYDRFVTAPLRRLYRDVPPSSQPGFMFLEIDGLAEPVLRDAIARGYMPTLQRWLASGSHKLVRWDPDLSAQTSASQAGILLGSNEGIPAFRWWDKPRQELLVSSKTGDRPHPGGGAVDRQRAAGAGRRRALERLLRQRRREHRGLQRLWRSRQRVPAITLLGYLLTPYMFSRILTLYLVDVVREWWQAWQQRRKNVLPRVHRGLKYSFIRAGTTTAMQEASRHILTADLLRGLPAVYNTFFGYDEVAHHSGIDREDSLKVLATLDKIFAHLERVAREAPRPYHLVRPLRSRAKPGRDVLAEIRSLAGRPDPPARRDGRRQERQHDGDAADRRGDRPRQPRAERGHPRRDAHGERAAPHPEASHVRRRGRARTSPTLTQLTSADPDATDVVVLASGNLGIISFPQWKERMTLEQLDAAFPRLIPGLVDHPGISLALVALRGARTAGDRQGRGVLPARRRASTARTRWRHSARTRRGISGARRSSPTCRTSWSSAAVDPVTGEVPAFEELVGNHGGLGGPQREPFLLYPAVFDPGAEEIVGAGHLHDVLKGWIEQEQGPD